ncbi:MDR family MFS transporter [Streptomyces sp. NPDC047097]|uniref:MDR family MFS transporter n=1 Tax=Streptomyces sp. NPDC047097 TaxID=3155260 RepID=UPI0033F8FA96
MTSADRGPSAGDGPRPPAPPPERLAHRQVVTVLSGLMLGMFLAALDQTVVLTALRTIADDLDAASAQAWITTAYLITATVSTPLYGKLADIHGRRPLYIAAITLFAAGSLLCGCATSLPQLAVFRGVQGLGGGGLMSLAMTVIADITTPRERGRYQGWFTAVFGGASVLGPLVGGLLAGAGDPAGVAGWRWIFLLNVPLSALALAVLLRVLRQVPHRPVRHRLDHPGALALVVGVVPLLLVAERGRDLGWTSPTALTLYAASAAGWTAFALLERRAGPAALLPPALLRIRTFRLGVLLHFCAAIGMFGAMAALPLYLQLARGMDPAAAGLAMLPSTAANVAVTLAVGRLVAHVGRPKPALVAGLGSLAAGLLVFSTLHPDSPPWYLALGLVLLGAGLGAAQQTMTTLAQSDVPRADMGAATAGVNFSRSIGGTLGTAAFLSLVFAFAADGVTARVASTLRDPALRHLAEDPANAETLAAVTRPDGTVDLEDTAFLGRLPSALARPFLEGYLDGLHAAFLLGTATALLACVLAATRVPDVTLADTPPPPSGDAPVKPPSGTSPQGA